MMKKILLILVVTFLASVEGSAQINKSVLKGDEFFSVYAFDKAIKQYESIGMNSLSTNALRKLGDCYRFTHQDHKAELVYAKLVSISDNKAEDLFMYAGLLQMNKKEAEAKKWINKFHLRKAEDSRGKGFVENLNKGQYATLKRDLGLFRIFNLSINSAKEDFSPVFYGDKVLFSSSRAKKSILKPSWNGNNFPFLDIYQADKSPDNSLKNVRLFSEKVNKLYHEAAVAFSPDLSLMAYTSNNYDDKSVDGEIKLKMFYKEKDDNGEWRESQPFPFNNKEYSVGHPTISSDGKIIYFVSDMPGGKGGTDLYKTYKTDSGWSSPESLGPNINTEGNEMFPFIHQNGMLFFASNGHFGLGGLDVFYSSFDATENYSKPINLGYPINDFKDDFGLIIDSSMTYGYFSSNRPGANGSDDIYMFKLDKKICDALYGRIIDENAQSMSGAIVKVLNARGEEVKSTSVNEKGKFEFCLTSGAYDLVATKDGYMPLNKKTLLEGSPLDVGGLKMKKVPDFSLVGTVIDAKTLLPISGVNIVLENLETASKDSVRTSLEGKFVKWISEKKLNDTVFYRMTLSKEGYFIKSVTDAKILVKEGVYYVDAELLKLDALVANLEDMVEFKNINFDLDKWNIRPDAAIELNKIVKVMNRYPDMVVELGSHTDCRASRMYNLELSKRRAIASANYIKDRISNPDRIYGYGYGEEKLLNRCACEKNVVSDCDEYDHFQNRRTEFVIIKVVGAKIKRSSLK